MGLWRVHVEVEDRPGRLGELAAAVGLSPSRLGHVFSEQIGLVQRCHTWLSSTSDFSERRFPVLGPFIMYSGHASRLCRLVLLALVEERPA